MLVLRRGLPLDYSLCRQTVTVYCRQGMGRQVLTDVYHDYKTAETVGSFGGEEQTGFTLIVPGECAIAPGDKVFPGLGPEAPWEELTPAAYPGLGTVKSVNPRYFQGTLCHTEVRG